MNDRPAKLYKYERIDAQTLRNLKAQSIYFGSPRGFNDPYDCAIAPNIRQPTNEEVEKVRALYLQDKELTDQQRRELVNLAVEKLAKLLHKSSVSAFKEQIENFLTTRGVACFAESPDNLLMWAHYGGKYKGMCLEFDTSYEPFTKARKVAYSKSLPEVSPMAILDSVIETNGTDHLMTPYCTKSESWAYEKEWRAFHMQAGTLYGYKSEALTGIYFGPDVEPEMREIICLVLRGQNEKVAFYEGRRSATEFKVGFQRFTYTSYLVAKQMGLRE
ncbi:DUF2971 domain-containing protein [Rhodoferax sp. BAB1]|uniref:DUF2971 domain-containing protein n=1 Tax=Rhodoferax sp. BAB1 TaxID=2741720 RepID=UPI00157556E1|nr:DUF2971 domain-containing protein [Rhodoferax sp. BAB1]QKO20497.1 DUF2971 domain-containing protein [Rhodoferax sp. BAB1]